MYRLSIKKYTEKEISKGKPWILIKNQLDNTVMLLLLLSKARQNKYVIRYNVLS